MKAKIHHRFAKEEKREGRGLHTTRSMEEEQSRLKNDLRHEENEVDRLRRARDETYEWYLDACQCYEEGIAEKEAVEEENAELKNRLSETASASSSSPTGIQGECTSMAEGQRSRTMESQSDTGSSHCSKRFRSATMD